MKRSEVASLIKSTLVSLLPPAVFPVRSVLVWSAPWSSDAISALAFFPKPSARCEPSPRFPFPQPRASARRSPQAESVKCNDLRRSPLESNHDAHAASRLGYTVDRSLNGRTATT